MLYSSSEFKVLLPLVGSDISTDIIKIASSILAEKSGNLVVLGTVEVPEEMSLSTGALQARNYRKFLENLTWFDKAQAIEIRNRVKVSRRIWDAIDAAAKDESCNLLIIPWFDESKSNISQSVSIKEVLDKSSTDLLIVRPGKNENIRKILVPLRGAPHINLIIDTAVAISHKFNAAITIMRILSEDVTNEGMQREEALLNSYLARRGLNQGDYNFLAVRSKNTAETVVKEAAQHDLIIMGTPLSSKSNGTRVGSVIKAVINNTNATVLVAQAVSTTANTSFLPEELLKLKNAENTVGESTVGISEVVDKWFAENTFHASEFSNIEKLLELKIKQGLTISLGLPALNEEQTIGDIIETVKGYLYDRYPLLDEIAVIDSGSSDKTVEIAKSYGVKVFKDDEILPQWGSRLGKGCALWKSLYVLKGDIVAWIDTDIKNIHPRFVYGLVGPILKYPRIKYVKGYYRRPVKIGDQFIETGGGRVTELTARPLLNLFFPELSGLVQPLSGEYAGRREVLEKVGFYNGYGVEMGLLINILEQFGLDVIGQVDLIERIHRNQSLENLSKMSFAIIQVVIENLEKRHRVELLQKMNKTMKLIMHEPNQFYLELKAIEESMKPPIATIPEYEGRFNELFSKNLLEDIG